MTLPAVRENYGLVPSNMGDAMKLAEMMASSKLVPQALQKSPADCLMVIQQAIRWQMDPFAVAQECSVIQGKLMHSGKLVAAVINARGNLAERLSFSYAGEGENRTITVSGRIQGEAQPRTVDVKHKDAKTQNAMWTKQPDQQLMYHGSRVWGRRHTPELMLGVYSPEEFDRSAEEIIEDWGERRGAGLIKAATLEPPPEHTELWTEDEDGTPPEWQGSKWDDLGPVKQAGVLCNEEGFWRFLTERCAKCDNAAAAAKIVRGLCNVETRAALAKDTEAARKWREVVAEYRAWQREPEIIEAQPERVPASAAASAPAPATGHQTEAAATIPTAADYWQWWDDRLANATRPDQVGTKWNGEKDLHQQITWTDEHPYEALKSRITKAIAAMKAPA